MNPSVKPIYSFEKLASEDLVSGVKSTAKSLTSRQFVKASPLGLGYERYLDWSLQDIQAAASTTAEQKMRFSVSAVMNARRSLSCLADQYLERDGLSYCRDAPRSADQKSKMLVRRGIFDKLAHDALARATALRDRIEHRYEGVGLNDVRYTVQLIRSTIENCVAKSDPYKAPTILGVFLGGCSSGKGSGNYSFDGWSGPLLVLARCQSPPWFGIVIPSSKTEAVVRKGRFSDMRCDDLLEAFVALEAQSSAGYTMVGEPTFAGQLEFLGLVD